MNQSLKVIPFDGLNSDCLGNYLAGLGLHAAAAQRWPNIRACWRAGRCLLLSNDPAIGEPEIKEYLLTDWRPTTYERWWTTAQKIDTKARTSTAIWHERSQTSLSEMRLLDAHIVGTGRNRFNPVLGTGGNVGKRDFAKACKDAIQLLAKPDRSLWLDAALSGRADVALPDLSNGGTWFVFANKTFNSGQRWYREGQLSPWSLLLAMEGAFLLVGSVNRRLGSRARPYAAFPFVSEPAQPETDGEIGMSRAEFWAPLWSFPATLSEIRALFRRGLAKLGGRPAQAPHEFAVAVLAAGVDSGISEFARFEFRQTTSSQVCEAIPLERIQGPASIESVASNITARQASSLLIPLIESGWVDRLPFEPHDPKQKGKFVGLAGPMESAIVRVSERPDDPQRWQQLLLRLADAQGRIDLNKDRRKSCIPVPPLSPRWFDVAWPMPTSEVMIARCIASIGWHPSADATPLQLNIFGVTFAGLRKRWRATFPNARPAQAVWRRGDPLQALFDVAQRRLVDGKESPFTPLSGPRRCAADLIKAFLARDGAVDLEEIARWIPPLSLIDWTSSDTVHDVCTKPALQEDGTAMLHALIRPLFHCDSVCNVRLAGRKPLFRSDNELPKPSLLRRLFQLLRFGALDEVVQILRDRYLATGHSIVMPPSNLVADGERIAAALLIPMFNDDVTSGLKRWLQPTRSF